MVCSSFVMLRVSDTDGMGISRWSLGVASGGSAGIISPIWGISTWALNRIKFSGSKASGIFLRIFRARLNNTVDNPADARTDLRKESNHRRKETFDAVDDDQQAVLYGLPETKEEVAHVGKESCDPFTGGCKCLGDFLRQPQHDHGGSLADGGAEGHQEAEGQGDRFGNERQKEADAGNENSNESSDDLAEYSCPGGQGVQDINRVVGNVDVEQLGKRFDKGSNSRSDLGQRFPKATEYGAKNPNDWLESFFDASRKCPQRFSLRDAQSGRCR